MVYDPLRPTRQTCSSWKELDQAIESLSGSEPYRFVFRGHRNALWNLQPSIERVCGPDEVLRKEANLFSEFRAKAHLYTEVLPPSDDAPSWLALMQHHDVPTRLLDWSYSAYIALYFAVRESGDEEWCALWAIDQKALCAVSDAATQKVFGCPLSKYLEDPERVLPRDGAYDDSSGLVAPFVPRFHVSRLSSQQGCFLLNANHRISFRESLACMMGEGGDWLHVMAFPSALRNEVLRRLMHMNIHPVSLFPDLGGLAKFLVLKNELFARP